jgi:hypothetical protein
MAIADNVLTGIRSVADLQELEIPAGEDELPLIYAEDAKENSYCGNALKMGASPTSQCLNRRS